MTKYVNQINFETNSSLSLIVVTFHFYRNVFPLRLAPRLKLVQKLTTKKVEDGIDETLNYCDFPSEHWTRIPNNVIERLNRAIWYRTRVVGSFPDGNSVLMLVCARLRHMAGTQRGNKKYMNMKHLEAALEAASIAS